MARPKSEIPVLEDRSEADIQTALEHSAVQKQLVINKHRLEKVDALLGITEFNEHALFEEALIRLQSSCTNLTWVGGAILLVKEHRGMPAAKSFCERLGLNKNYGMRIAGAYMRFRDHGELQTLGISKMLELMPIEDDLIEQIENGSIIDAKISDLQRMSVRELHVKVIALLEENRSGKERLVEARAEKDAALDKLETRDKALQDNQTKVGAYLGMLQTADMQLISAIRHRGKVNNLLSEALEQTKIKLTAAQDESRVGNLGEIQRLLDDAEISVIPIRSVESAFGALE